MGRRCTVCTHEDCDEIDEAIVRGKSYRDIADEYGLSKDSVRRHRHNHLPEKLVKAYEAEQADHASDLLEQLQQLQETTLRILDDAEADGDRYVALQAVREARSNLSLLGEVVGHLARQPDVNVHVETLQAVVLDALNGRPEAKADVARAIYETGDPTQEGEA